MPKMEMSVAARGLAPRDDMKKLIRGLSTDTLRDVLKAQQEASRLLRDELKRRTARGKRRAS